MKRSAPLKRRRPMKLVRAERALEQQAYRFAKGVFLRRHPYCEMFVDCLSPSVDVHHLKGRRGALLCDEQFWRATCRAHHDWVHTHARKARELGLILYK